MKDNIIRECFRQFYSIRECMVELQFHGLKVSEQEVSRAYDAMTCDLHDTNEALAELEWNHAL